MTMGNIIQYRKVSAIFTDKNDFIWYMDLTFKGGRFAPPATLFHDHAAICHQNASLSIPGGFQKNHETPLYAHHTPGGDRGRIDPMKWGRAGVRVYQLIHVPVRSVAEAYHVSCEKR